MRQTRFFFPFCFVLVSITMAMASPSLEAQTLVYKTAFEKGGQSINFDFFDQGFFVVNGLGGQGTFIFTYREDGRDFYLTAENSGELFFAVRPGVEKAVIRASAETGTAISQYLLIGDLSSKVSLNLRGQRITLAVASTLRGSALSSDSEADADFPAVDQSIGIAGFATIKATLQRDLTRAANRANQDVSQAVADLIADLERQGIENGASDSAAAVTTGPVSP